MSRYAAGETVWANGRKATVLYVTMTRAGTRVGVQYLPTVTAEIPLDQVRKRKPEKTS